MTRRFLESLGRFARHQGVNVFAFRKSERKDDTAQGLLRSRTDGEGVVCIGKARETARVLRTRKRIDSATGRASPELVDSTAMVNACYTFLVDDNFGPCFIKFCVYFQYNTKLCINGHECLKRRLEKRSIPFEVPDNGIMSGTDPAVVLVALLMHAFLSAGRSNRQLREVAAQFRQSGSYGEGQATCGDCACED